VFIFLGAASCTARSETHEIDRLAERADAVVVGGVQSGFQSGHSVTFVLSVDRTLKGELSPGSTASASWRSAMSANKGLKGNYGLWFLAKADVGLWTLLGVLQGQYPFEFAYFPVPKGSVPAIASTSPPVTVSDHIAVELASALEVYTDHTQLSRLATGLLGIGDSAVTQGLYQTLRTSTDPSLKFVGVSGLLRSNDISVLADVANDIELIPNLHAVGLIPAVCGVRNPLATPYLGKIAASTDEELQRCAAMALDYIHTRDTLPFLAVLLASGDPATREYAIQGLSRFVDNLPIQNQSNVLNGGALTAQGPTPYRTPETDEYSLSRGWLAGRDDTPYLDFWKSWWAATGSKIAASAP
jgi:hypothetical protein